ncbi:MFS transporter [Amycolatopsis sp. YIM 10]|uniref:MFS transporter n=1 Tax=Amycolatopsis sp. YIM 10 TaxID=2653857 RepID=UPI0012900860|nr:MFS transporter [Amycolatopsis sp. YIM 10]QFU92980.1 Inner membrane protein YbjJ [Amycolatopsis sp. YIM 10]
MVSARTAVFVVFALNGCALGSWAPRVPALTEQVGAVPGSLGLALLGASVGLLLAATVTGRLVEWLGARLVMALSTVAAALVLAALGLTTSVLWLGITLFALGAAIGVLDVSMNVAAVFVERGAGKPLMPVFHAGFSFGALTGALFAGLAASHGWTPARQLAVAAIFAILVLFAVVKALPGVKPHHETRAKRTSAVAPIKRPVLWLLATIALCSAIAEGASSDWSALLLVAEHGIAEGPAALAYAGFSLAMAIARLSGGLLQTKLGERPVLAGGALLAAIGLLAAALVSSPIVGFAGFALAGAGLAASFPVALGLAGEAGKRADGGGGEREIAFVTSVAYTGFLAGPPVIGGIAQLTSLSTSFVVVALVAAMIAPATVAALRAGRRERERSYC